MTNKTALDVDDTGHEIVTFSVMLMSFLKIVSFLLMTFSSKTIKISWHSLCHRALWLGSVGDASDYPTKDETSWLKVFSVLWNAGNWIWYRVLWIPISLKFSVKACALCDCKKS